MRVEGGGGIDERFDETPARQRSEELQDDTHCLAIFAGLRTGIGLCHDAPT